MHVNHGMLLRDCFTLDWLHLETIARPLNWYQKYLLYRTVGSIIRNSTV